MAHDVHVIINMKKYTVYLSKKVRRFGILFVIYLPCHEKKSNNDNKRDHQLFFFFDYYLYYI